MRYVTKSLLTHIHVDKLYTLQVYLGRWTRPDTYICSAFAKKAELKAVGGGGGLGDEDFEWGRGKCASLYTGSSV